MAREIFTPEDYSFIFNEGLTAFRKQGEKAISPYLKLTFNSITDQVRASAWEMGWWAGYNVVMAAIKDVVPTREKMKPSEQTYGMPSIKASFWVWEDTVSGERATVQASAEMESLARLRADFKNIGTVRLAERYLPGYKITADA